MADSEAVEQARRSLGRQLAAYRRAAGHTQAAYASLVRYARSTIANVETGRQNVSRDFWVRGDETLGLGGALLRSYEEYAGLRRQQHRDSATGLSMRGLLAAAPVLDRPAKRRRLLDIAGTAIIAAALGGTTTRPLDNLTAALAMPHHLATSVGDLDLTAITSEVARCKRSYQACRYREVISGLPAILDVAASTIDAERGNPVHVLSAETYQVTGSLLLKFHETGLALLAAGRSLDAAWRSGDPIAVAASARVFTHALMASGHPGRAAEYARSVADRFERNSADGSTSGLAVYGALLLRGAVAAARHEDRATTHQLLDEAADTAARIGRDGNVRWTAFGPTNVLLHHVNVSVALGDAGRAIDYARQVHLGRIPVAERRAGLFIDMGRAYTQWGKYDRAHRALAAAEETAPEEMRARRSVRSLVADLVERAPNQLQTRFREMAERIGPLV